MFSVMMIIRTMINNTRNIYTKVTSLVDLSIECVLKYCNLNDNLIISDIFMLALLSDQHFSLKCNYGANPNFEPFFKLKQIK